MACAEMHADQRRRDDMRWQWRRVHDRFLSWIPFHLQAYVLTLSFPFSNSLSPPLTMKFALAILLLLSPAVLGRRLLQDGVSATRDRSPGFGPRSHVNPRPAGWARCCHLLSCANARTPSEEHPFRDLFARTADPAAHRPCAPCSLPACSALISPLSMPCPRCLMSSPCSRVGVLSHSHNAGVQSSDCERRTVRRWRAPTVRAPIASPFLCRLQPAAQRYSRGRDRLPAQQHGCAGADQPSGPPGAGKALPPPPPLLPLLLRFGPAQALQPRLPRRCCCRCACVACLLALS
jgi:hypothetical protein